MTMTIARLDDDDDITVDDEGVDNDGGDIFDHFEAHQGDPCLSCVKQRLSLV